VVQELDSVGRVTDTWFRFNNHVVFSVECKFRADGQLHYWRRQVRCIVSLVVIPTTTATTTATPA